MRAEIKIEEGRPTLEIRPDTATEKAALATMGGQFGLVYVVNEDRWVMRDSAIPTVMSSVLSSANRGSGGGGSGGGVVVMSSVSTTAKSPRRARHGDIVEFHNKTTGTCRPALVVQLRSGENCDLFVFWHPADQPLDGSQPLDAVVGNVPRNGHPLATIWWTFRPGEG